MKRTPECRRLTSRTVELQKTNLPLSSGSYHFFPDGSTTYKHCYSGKRFSTHLPLIDNYYLLRVGGLETFFLNNNVNRLYFHQEKSLKQILQIEMSVNSIAYATANNNVMQHLTRGCSSLTILKLRWLYTTPKKDTAYKCSFEEAEKSQKMHQCQQRSQSEE